MHLPYLTKMLRKYIEFLNVLCILHVRASTHPYVSIAILIVYLSFFSTGSTIEELLGRKNSGSGLESR
jgi:hypothetical protein